MVGGRRIGNWGTLRVLHDRWHIPSQSIVACRTGVGVNSEDVAGDEKGYVRMGEGMCYLQESERGQPCLFVDGMGRACSCTLCCPSSPSTASSSPKATDAPLLEIAESIPPPPPLSSSMHRN